MQEYFKKISIQNPRLRKAIGIVLVVIGVISVITPFTPLGFLLVIGLEILGLRILLWDRLKRWFKGDFTK